MSFLTDQYVVYVLSAYGASFAIIAWMVWSSVRANARAREELERIERERGS